MRQVVLDTETTGLSPEAGDRIVEIGCVELLGRRPTGSTLHHYVNPERANSEGALQVHGLTDEFLAEQPRFAAICDELLAFIDGAELVIHNAPFDVGFLNAELQRIGRAPLHTAVAGVVDSLALARELYPGKAASLDALCKRFEVDNSNRTLHGALLDADLLAQVYVRMTRGQHELAMAEHAHAAGAQAGQGDVDLASLALPLLAATADELAAHEAMLVRLDKDSGGKTLWRTTAAPVAQ